MPTVATKLSQLPGDATEDAVRVHEAAARLADRSGLFRQALAHRELAARIRNGRARNADEGGPALRAPIA